MGEIVIIGGTRGTGRSLASELGRRGKKVVIAGRDIDRAAMVACELNIALNAGREGPGRVIRGLAADLARPNSLAKSLEGVTEVDHLVLAGTVRDRGELNESDTNRALQLATATIIGYTAILHILKSRITPPGSVLIFGGVSKTAPYPGSTTMIAVNQAVPGLVATFARKIAPVRVNSIHPAIVCDSPTWVAKEALLAEGKNRTIQKRLPTMADIVDGCIFLLNNPAATAINLSLDAGGA